MIVVDDRNYGHSVIEDIPAGEIFEGGSGEFYLMLYSSDNYSAARLSDGTISNFNYDDIVTKCNAVVTIRNSEDQ